MNLETYVKRRRFVQISTLPDGPRKDAALAGVARSLRTSAQSDPGPRPLRLFCRHDPRQVIRSGNVFICPACGEKP